MSEKSPKVEFALGNKVVTENFFKSAFARSVVANFRDTGSLDLFNNSLQSGSDIFSSDGFFSFLNIGASSESSMSSVSFASAWEPYGHAHAGCASNAVEVEKLRKQCYALRQENKRLTETLQACQLPRVRVVDNVILQSQVESLQWQIKQIDANRKMFRSLMGQVVRFLERAKKSLDTLHEKSNPKGKASRVPRSRSVHAVNQNTTPGKERNDDTTPSRSNGGSSRFARAKSVAQISPQSSGYSFKDCTWSVLRRNDQAQSTPARAKSTNQDLNRTQEDIVYRTPTTPAEVDPDTLPPEKLSQEASRLMRTVLLLLAIREPDMVSSSDVEMSSSPVENELSSLQSNNFANSTAVNDGASYNGGTSSSDRISTGSSVDIERTRSAMSPTGALEASTSRNNTLQILPPATRSSADTGSFAPCQSNSCSNTKIIEKVKEPEKIARPESSGSNGSAASRELFPAKEGVQTSTPNRRVGKKSERRSWFRMRSKVAPAENITDVQAAGKPANRNSTEDESGFSSMNSFQEVGLPQPFRRPISPNRGSPIDIGLPEIPLDKAHHRRWSSNPIEIQNTFKRSSAQFAHPPRNSESLSVWV